MTGVRTDSRIAFLQGGSECGISYGACPSPVPDRLQFVVPAGRGQPDLDLDVGIGGWRQRRADPAEGWQLREGTRPDAATTVRRCECARADALDGVNPSPVDGESAQVLARRTGRADGG